MTTLFFIPVKTLTDYSLTDFLYNNGIDLILTIVTLSGVLLTLKSIRNHNEKIEGEIKRKKERDSELNERILKTLQASTKTSRFMINFMSKKKKLFKDYKSVIDNRYHIKINHDNTIFDTEEAAKIFVLAYMLELHRIESHIIKYENTLNKFLLNYQNVLSIESIQKITDQIIEINNLSVILNQFDAKDIISHKNNLENHNRKEYLKTRYEMMEHIYSLFNKIIEFSND